MNRMLCNLLRRLGINTKQKNDQGGDEGDMIGPKKGVRREKARVRPFPSGSDSSAFHIFSLFFFFSKGTEKHSI